MRDRLWTKRGKSKLVRAVNYAALSRGLRASQPGTSGDSNPRIDRTPRCRACVVLVRGQHLAYAAKCVLLFCREHGAFFATRSELFGTRRCCFLAG